LLIKDVAAEFGDRVKVSTEEYGNSETARRFGVRRYPVVFVDDVLVARPKDFGFAGPDDVGPGLYVPFREAPNQKRFKDDLRRMVERRLKGERVAGLSADEVTAAASADGPPELPRLKVEDLAGSALDLEGLSGRVVVVEMWATWCPPCRSTLTWLNALQRKHGDRLAVVAVSVDSKPDDVRAMMAELKPAYRVVLSTPDVLKAFGEVAAVPKLFVFDKSGRRAEVFYGAPPDLHDNIEKAVARLIF
jgi:thiol-disulfide isomerase/thioredoxin